MSRRVRTPGDVRNSRASGRTNSTGSDCLTGLTTEFPVTTTLGIEVITLLDSIDSYLSGPISTRLWGGGDHRREWEAEPSRDGTI